MASVASAPYHHAQYSKPQRPPKDPNKPKKKKSAFDIFREEQFHEFKRLNPDTKLDLGVFMTSISQTWHALPKEKRQPYYTLSEKDAERYDEQMANYVPPPEYANFKRGKKRKRVKQPGEPKKAMSPFMFFSNVTRPEVVAENPDLKIGPVAKILGARWNSMGEVDRAPYQKMADDDKMRYQVEMEQFRKSQLV